MGAGVSFVAAGAGANFFSCCWLSGGGSIFGDNLFFRVL